MKLRFGDDDMQNWWQACTAGERFSVLMQLYNADLITAEQLRALLKLDVKDRSL